MTFVYLHESAMLDMLKPVAPEIFRKAQIGGLAWVSAWDGDMLWHPEVLPAIPEIVTRTNYAAINFPALSWKAKGKQAGGKPDRLGFAPEEDAFPVLFVPVTGVRFPIHKGDTLHILAGAIFSVSAGG